MSYTTFLTPRPEILSEEGPEPIIDLANVEDSRRRKLEARPEEFFALTYPTSDMRRVIGNISERFSGRVGVPGLFLFEGLKGSGKSHLLVTVYHLFHSPTQAKAWLEQHGIACSLPEDVTVIHNKFTDQPLESIWDFIFLKLTGRQPVRSVVQPGLSEVEQVLGGKKLVLILDELEQGIRSISDPAIQSQNIAFLHMLSEWSIRSNQVTIFASIYSDVQEPGSTLKRGATVRVQFAQTSEKDRARVVLHRLFGNYLSFDPRAVSTVIESYVSYWSRYQRFNADEYRDRLSQTFPFTPDLLDVLLTRVPARGGFQNVRGALGFLANLVRLTHQTVDLVTCGHASLADREIMVRLSDLDTSGDLVTRARDNFNDLKSGLPLSDQLAAATLLYTLAGAGRNVGATKDELMRATLKPGSDINDFERTINAFQKYAANFHENDGRYYFDLEENADAKIEFHSLRREYEEKAPAEIRKVWLTDVFGEPSAVVYHSDDALTREAIEQLDKGRIRWVLSPRRLTPQERHTLYFGLTARNEVILLEPKDNAFNLDRNADMQKWMRRSLAAADLASRTTDAGRRDEYTRISREERGYVVSAIRRAGLIYIKWVVFASQPLADEVEEETLGSHTKREDVLTALGQNHYPPALFIDHLSDRVNDILRRNVKEIDQEYRNTLGFPVPTHQGRVTGAIRQLCKDRKISLNHQRGNFCGNDLSLSEPEILNASIDAPFSETIHTSSRPSTSVEPGNGQGWNTLWTNPSIESDEETPIQIPAATVGALDDVSTLPQTSIGALRQAIAERLQALTDVKVKQVSFSVVLERSAGDLSTLPSTIRGSLSGSGDVYAEINIKRRGDFTKAEVEDMAERLPVIAGAEYRADLKVKPGDDNGN